MRNLKKEVGFQRRLMISVLCLTIPLILVLLANWAVKKVGGEESGLF